MLRLRVDDAIGGGVDARVAAAEQELPVAVAVPGEKSSATPTRDRGRGLVSESHARTGITEQSVLNSSGLRVVACCAA